MTIREKRMREMVANGKTVREISIALHTSQPALRAQLANFGLMAREEETQQKPRNPRTECSMEPLPPFHPIAAAFLPKLASLQSGEAD